MPRASTERSLVGRTVDHVERLTVVDQPDFEELLDLMDTPAWHADAACKEAPQSVSWFPTKKSDTGAEAKDTCRRCLAREDCLTWALDQGPDLDGVWAGTSAKERRAIRSGRVA